MQCCKKNRGVYGKPRQNNIKNLSKNFCFASTPMPRPSLGHRSREVGRNFYLTLTFKVSRERGGSGSGSSGAAVGVTGLATTLIRFISESSCTWQSAEASSRTGSGSDIGMQICKNPVQQSKFNQTAIPQQLPPLAAATVVTCLHVDTRGVYVMCRERKWLGFFTF